MLEGKEIMTFFKLSAKYFSFKPRYKIILSLDFSWKSFSFNKFTDVISFIIYSLQTLSNFSGGTSLYSKRKLLIYSYKCSAFSSIDELSRSSVGFVFAFAFALTAKCGIDIQTDKITIVSFFNIFKFISSNITYNQAL